MSTAFHPQTDGQTERQNQTIQEYLRAFCMENQLSWARMLPMAEFAYNNSKHATTSITPFYAVYNFHPEIYFDIGDDIEKERVPAARVKAEELQNTRETLEKRWREAADSQTKYYNQKHKPLAFKKNDMVLLATKNLKLKLPSKKLSPRFTGPFRVLEPVGLQAYRLQLPATWKIHDVFHISLLEKYHRREDSEDIQEPLPLAELVDGQEEWEIEEILDKKKRSGKIWYYIKWNGYPEEFNQWLPGEELEHAEELREQFEEKTKPNRTRRARNAQG